MATKEVNFRLYCPKCQFYPLQETEDPCNECLAQGWNEDSTKPVRFKGKEGYANEAKKEN